MTAQLTPGPYEVDRNDEHRDVLIITADQKIAVASMWLENVDGNRDDVMPDAHLLAASWDMLMVLEKAVNWLYAHPYQADHMSNQFIRETGFTTMAVAAINKARWVQTRTRQEALDLAVKDYWEALYEYRHVAVVLGYRGDDSVEIQCDPPAHVEVCITPTDDIKRICDNHVDPYWNVRLLEPHPALDGVRGLEIYGPSYQFKAGT